LAFKEDLGVPDRLRAIDFTTVVWLFGHPVGHSLSPIMHNAAFRHSGLDMTYIARDVRPEELAAAVEELRSPLARGANLTLPHKQAVLPLLDDVEEEAARIGAVNTIVNQDGRLRGHNTDFGGFLSALRTLSEDGATGARCLVLGAGGAARAVVAALVQDGAAQVWVANRTIERAAALSETASAWGTTAVDGLSMGDLDGVIAGCEVVVNATSLGLPHSVKDLPLDVDTLHSGQVLIDLVYGTEPTPLVKAARGKGLKAIDGKEMLVQQAALSYSLWTGMDAPLEVMRGSISGR
jgi:shikimate dehydrogenase